MTTEELAKLTPEQKNARIMELCGWKPHKDSDYPYSMGREPSTGNWTNNPNYLNDLNAMHEAEKVLTEKQSVKYNDILMQMTPLGRWQHATAAQRADAFLLTTV